MKGATGLYSADLHKMGWAIFRKMGFSPKWEKVACEVPVFSAIHPNHPQFGHFYGLRWEVFHRRLIAQSQNYLHKNLNKSTQFIHKFFSILLICIFILQEAYGGTNEETYCRCNRCTSYDSLCWGWNIYHRWGGPA